MNPGRRRIGPATLAARGVEIAAELAQFDPDVPTRLDALPMPVTALDALVRGGYLRRQGDGYLRTAKPFHVEL